LRLIEIGQWQERKWPPWARLLFIVAAALALWGIIALIFLSLFG